MAISAFDDRSKQPTEEYLKATLGSAYALWTDLQNQIALTYSASPEWGYASKKSGWGMRMRAEKGKRVVLYMTPCKDYFIASFALGEKAVEALHESDLPASVLEIIDSAQKYVEGRAVRLEVRSAADVSSVVKIAAAKMAN
ncbi:DUF3788 domain-containing protein [Methanocella arvoryzae]|uniref:DUF3788 family protein n=1 Tax=Methanocella arvoryzae (strain DSM 22066 / NBRC 105507 / MRE50) TaxID=351160 RepID=Q0W646_METAR|nr:DUF3788 domain-containing protein [Methanocella arvoryzae]CAJ36147.1 conserved hypothetical protein [Methanocella arvoryzae MRE50]